MKRRISATIAAGAMMIAMSSANAASLSLVYTGENSIEDGVVQATVGDVLTFDLVMDFSGTQLGFPETTAGGNFDILFDLEAMTFVDYVSAGLGQPSFERIPDLTDEGLIFGEFGSFEGLTGPDVVATVTVLAASAGDTNMTTSDGFGYTYFSIVTFADIDVDFNGIDIAVAPIPLPAAVWFLLSGLGALVGLRRTPT